MSDMNQGTWEKYPAALPKETILAGQYVIKDVLGQGGFGITYLAEDHRTKSKVAVKEFFPETMAMRSTALIEVRTYTDDRLENFNFGMKSFLEEAKVLAQFQGNPNIVGARRYFEENGTAYFVMDYIEGIDFKTYIKQNGGKLAWEEVWKIMSPIMDALDAVHKKGLIHRDVTPDNILISEDGTVKLIDFGAARYSIGERSQSLDIVLKPGYTPKEQYVRRGRQGAYTDVYSVAACFYAALSGYLPPESLERMEEDNLVPLSTRGVELPPVAEKAILKGLEVRAEDRFQTMDAFKSAIMGMAPFVEPKPEPTPEPVSQPIPDLPAPESPMPPAPKPNNKKLIAGAVCAAAVAVICLAVGLANGSHKETTPSEDRKDIVVAENEQSTVEPEPESDINTQENVTGSDEQEDKQSIPVLMQDTQSIYGSRYKGEETAQADEGDNEYYLDVINAMFDVLCKDDASSYTRLELGTADEAHENYENIQGSFLSEMLSHELYDEYGDEYHKFLKEAFAMSDYTISSVDMDNDSCVATISYRQLKYFEAVEKEYKGYVRLAMEEWLDNPEEIPTDEEELKTHVLALLYLSMRDALESVEYGKKVSAEVDLDSDGEDGLVAFFFDGLFDTYKLEPYAEKKEKGLEIRGYDDTHYLYIWDDGDAYIGEWRDDTQNGKGIYVWSSGSVYAGSWKDGKRNGYGVNIYSDGSRYDGNWKNDEKID